MDLLFEISIMVFFLNFFFCLVQYGIQQGDQEDRLIPARHSPLTGTNQKFLYWQDFSTQTWGDILGLGMVWIAFAHIASLLSLVGWILITGAGVVSAFTFWVVCTREFHKPDWGYPKMCQTSAGGYAHLVYFGMSVAFTLACLKFAFGGVLTGWPLVLFIFGSVIWTAAAIRDWAMGRFEPLKPILPPPKERQ